MSAQPDIYADCGVDDCDGYTGPRGHAEGCWLHCDCYGGNDGGDQ